MKLTFAGSILLSLGSSTTAFVVPTSLHSGGTTITTSIVDVGNGCVGMRPSCLFGTRKNLDEAWSNAEHMGQNAAQVTADAARFSVRQSKYELLTTLASASAAVVSEDSIEAASAEFEALGGGDIIRSTSSTDSAAARRNSISLLQQAVIVAELEFYKDLTAATQQSLDKDAFIAAAAEAEDKYHQAVHAAEAQFAPAAFTTKTTTAPLMTTTSPVETSTIQLEKEENDETPSFSMEDFLEEISNEEQDIFDLPVQDTTFIPSTTAVEDMKSVPTFFMEEEVTGAFGISIPEKSPSKMSNIDEKVSTYFSTMEKTVFKGKTPKVIEETKAKVNKFMEDTQLKEEAPKMLEKAGGILAGAANLFLKEVASPMLRKVGDSLKEAKAAREEKSKAEEEK